MTQQKEASEREVVQVKQQNEREKASLQRQLAEKQREKEDAEQVLNQQIESLQQGMEDRQRQVDSLTEEKEVLQETVSQLEALLTDAETKITEGRQRAQAREREEIVNIPSRHIRLTNEKLGSGSYGGAVTSLSMLSILPLSRVYSPSRCSRCLLARLPCGGEDATRSVGNRPA